MSRDAQIWRSVQEHIHLCRPEGPVLYFRPDVLARSAAQFRAGFDGLVSFAVKANPSPVVLENLAAAGVTAFDVASPAEIALVRRHLPGAVLHYNNPVRSRAEIAAGVAAGVASWSVDSPGELAKLAEQLPEGAEVAVRLALPVAGAAYDFTEKFGAAPERAAELLRAVVAAGFTPAMTFHPGTQCTAPEAWARYIATCAEVARGAGVRLARLNVGGGFPADRNGAGADLGAIFAAIHLARAAAFGPGAPGDTAPGLVCEPGRAMVADAFALGVQVKAVRDCGALFLSDGIYGSLAEAAQMGHVDRLRVFTPDGTERRGAPVARVLFGPSCDSLDRLPDPVALPGDICEGDQVLFAGMGAYSVAMATRFNGYGACEIVTIGPGAAQQ